MVFSDSILKRFLLFRISNFQRKVIFSWIRFICCLNQRRAWRDALKQSRQKNQKTEIRKRKGKEIKKERKQKIRNCAFILNIEELVREASVPNLPGVQPRRRFFYLKVNLKCFVFLNTKKTPTRLNPWEIWDLRLAY